MPISRSSRDGSSGSHGSSPLGVGCLAPEQLVQLSPFINAQAIRLVWHDSSQVFSRAQVCLSTETSPTSYFDREVQSKPRVPDIVLAWPFPLVCLGVLVKETKVSGSNVSIGRERVAAALLIASEVACSSKASRADVQTIKHLASSSHSSITFG